MRNRQRPAALTKVAAKFLLLHFILQYAVMALFFYGMFRDVELLVSDVEPLIWIAFLLSCMPWMSMFAIAFWRRPRLLADRTLRRAGDVFLDPSTPWWKLAGMTAMLAVVTTIFAYWASFRGFAKLSHYATRRPGSVIVTVIDKFSTGTKRSCGDRLYIEGFGHEHDYVCVADTFFESVEVGAQLQLTGQVSNYGIEPESIELLPR